MAGSLTEAKRLVASRNAFLAPYIIYRPSTSGRSFFISTLFITLHKGITAHVHESITARMHK